MRMLTWSTRGNISPVRFSSLKTMDLHYFPWFPSKDTKHNHIRGHEHKAVCGLVLTCSHISTHVITDWLWIRSSCAVWTAGGSEGPFILLSNSEACLCWVLLMPALSLHSPHIQAYSTELSLICVNLSFFLFFFFFVLLFIIKLHLIPFPFDWHGSSSTSQQ